MRTAEKVSQTSPAAMRSLGHAKTCGATGKKQFRTKRKARLAAEALSRRLDHPMYMYRCGCCVGWHLTSEKPRKKGA